MLMPKATVNEDGCPTLWKNNVGRTRQIVAVQSEAIAESVQQLSNRDFRSCVLLCYQAHVGTARFRRKMISHDPKFSMRVKAATLRSYACTVLRHAVE